MATGLGAFIGGFAKGMSDAQEMEARQQAIERDKERIAMEKDRFALEKQRAEREATMGELARQEAEISLAQKKRDEEYQADNRLIYDKVRQLSQAGYEAEEITPDGKVVAMRRFQDGASAVAEAKSRGNQFRPGSLRRVGELDSTDKAILFRDLNNENLIKHARMTPEIAFAARKQDKELESEGALEALKYFEATGDEAGTKKMFAKKGKLDIPADVALKLVPDEMTGGMKTVGTRIVNGKEEVVFDSFLNVILPSMGVKEYAAFQASQRQEGQKQKAETKRTAMKIESEEKISRESNKAAFDRTVYGEKNANWRASLKTEAGDDKVGERLLKLAYPIIEKLASNPSYQADPNSLQQGISKQVSAARALYENKQVGTLEEAWAQATRKYPLPTAK